MFIICKFGDQDNRVLVNCDEDTKLKEIGLEKEKEITLDELLGNSDYQKLSLLYYPDLLARILNKKVRTITKILSEAHIETFEEYKREYENIQNKTSKLSRSQRDYLVNRYNQLINV